MSDTPKFEVIDRRKFKAAEEEKESHSAAHQANISPPEPEIPSAGPQLVVSEPKPSLELEDNGSDAAIQDQAGPEFPPAPTAEESREQKLAYDASAQRLEELVRAQNPAVGAQPPMTFEHLVQQFYVSAMIQMGAGAQDGQRPRVDILGARTTIDLLGVLAEKTKGNLTESESKLVQTALFEVRMGFLEITQALARQAQAKQTAPPGTPPPGPKIVR